MQRIYLDHNATTPPLEVVQETVARVAREAFANPGSRHAFGRQARRVLEECREQLASLLGAKPEEVRFTSGGTEANHLAIHGLLRGQGATIALSPGEHPSVQENCTALQQRGWQLHKLAVDATGRLKTDALNELDPASVKLLTFILAHNEIGVIQEVTPWAAFCLQHGIPFHLDAVQAVGKLPVNFAALGCNTLSFGAHKFHGPRGIGGLLVRQGTKLTPQLLGGHQEFAQRAGTEAVALIAGMTTALQLWHDAAEARTTQLQRQRDDFEQALQAACGPLVIHGRAANRLPNTSCISFPALDGEALLIALDLEGVACSLGSTCASGSAEPAPILVAMGCSPAEFKSAVRFSLGITNTDAEITDAVSRIARVVVRLKKLAPQS